MESSPAEFETKAPVRIRGQPHERNNREKKKTPEKLQKMEVFVILQRAPAKSETMKENQRIDVLLSCT
jgi:hypothetical protein